MSSCTSQLPNEILLMILANLISGSKVEEIAISKGVFFPSRDLHHAYQIVKFTGARPGGGFQSDSRALCDLRLVCRLWNAALANELQKRRSQPLYWLSGFDLQTMCQWIQHVGEAEIGRIKCLILERGPATWAPHPVPYRPSQLWLDAELPRQTIPDSRHININPFHRSDWLDDHKTLCPHVLAINTAAWPSLHKNGDEIEPYFGVWSMDGQHWGFERFCDRPSGLLDEVEGWKQTGSATLTGHVLLEAVRYLAGSGT